MTKGKAYELFKYTRLKEYAESISFNRSYIDLIPNYYKAAVMLYCKYQHNWWYYMHDNLVGRCIMMKKKSYTKNMGIIRKVDLENNLVYVYNKKLPEGMENYQMDYHTLEAQLNWGDCHIRLINAYDK